MLRTELRTREIHSLPNRLHCCAADGVAISALARVFPPLFQPRSSIHRFHCQCRRQSLLKPSWIVSHKLVELRSDRKVFLWISNRTKPQFSKLRKFGSTPARSIDQPCLVIPPLAPTNRIRRAGCAALIVWSHRTVYNRYVSLDSYTQGHRMVLLGIHR